MTPDLSIIVVGDGAELLRPLLRALDAQTAKARMELVVVAPSAAHQAIRDIMPGGLAGSRYIDRTPLRSIPPAKAEGVRAAQSEVVAFTETHAFPCPDWAQALIEAHSRERCAAVGPSLLNANPRPLSWANMLVDYGPFLAGGRLRDPCQVSDLPGHNSSYRREVLLGYSERLEVMLEFETALHEDLRQRGQRLVLEPRARIAHVNVTRARAWLPERWHAGRIYAAARGRHWTRFRRLLYVMAWPAIPLVRLRRATSDARRAGHGGVLRSALPFIAAGLVVQSAGESWGYARGPGSKVQLFDMELRRFDYLAADDPLRAQ